MTLEWMQTTYQPDFVEPTNLSHRDAVERAVWQSFPEKTAMGALSEKPILPGFEAKSYKLLEREFNIRLRRGGRRTWVDEAGTQHTEIKADSVYRWADRITKNLEFEAKWITDSRAAIQIHRHDIWPTQQKAIALLTESGKPNMRLRISKVLGYRAFLSNKVQHATTDILQEYTINSTRQLSDVVEDLLKARIRQTSPNDKIDIYTQTQLKKALVQDLYALISLISPDYLKWIKTPVTPVPTSNPLKG